MKIVIPVGETLRVEFEDCDGGFDIRLDANQITVTTDLLGETKTLYHQSFGLEDFEFPASDEETDSQPLVGGVNPVHEHDGQWWHWDEPWSYRYGPYASETDATAALTRYAANLNASYQPLPPLGEDDPKPVNAMIRANDPKIGE